MKHNVSVRQLYQSEDNYTYSHMCEQAILAWVCTRRSIDPSEIIMAPDGYHPQYDASVRGIKYEIKFTKYSQIQIEYARYDGTPSALSLSEADHYLMISSGRSKVNGQWMDVGKVRLYDKNYLVKEAKKQIDIGNIVAYKPSPSGPGSLNVQFNPKLLIDDWVGDIEMNVTEAGTIFSFEV